MIVSPEMVFVGFLVGMSVGLTGMGGGALLTPVLIVFFGVRPATAIGTTLAWMALTKLLGSARHLQLRTVNRQTVRFLCLGGIPATVAGASFTALLTRSFPQQADIILTRILAITLIMIALLMYYHAAFRRQQYQDLPGQWMGARRRPFSVLVGFIGGLSMGITSSGSGTYVVMFLSWLYPLGAATVAGTAVVYGAIVTSIAAVLHAIYGHIDLMLLPSLVLGSLPGIYLGSSLCARLPELILRPLAATLIIAAAIKMV